MSFEDHWLTRLVKLCQPTPLRGEDFEQMAVERDDINPGNRPDRLIRRKLLASDGRPTRLLLFGSRGCGKSTELSRIEVLLRERYLVVGLNLAENRLNPTSEIPSDSIMPQDLIYLIAISVARACELAIGVKPELPLKELDKVLKKILPKDVSPRVSVSKVIGNVVLFGSTLIFDPSGTTGTAAVAANVTGQEILKNFAELTSKAVRWDIELSGVFRKQFNNNQSNTLLLNAVNTVLKEVERLTGRPVLVLIDELDKVPRPEVSFHILTNERMLSSLFCSLVICAPGSLNHNERLPMLIDHNYEVSFLHHVQYLTRQEPELPDEKGREKLRSILENRLKASGEGAGLSDEAREVIVDQSGGVVRHLVRLLLSSAQSAKVELVSGETVDRIERRHVDDAVQELYNVFKYFFQQPGVKTALLEVQESRNLPKDPVLGQRLLYGNFIVNYLDEKGTPWCYPHAILLDALRDAHTEA